MAFAGRVWRHIPAGAHPLDFRFLLKAAGRWNRRKLYGALYTSLDAVTASAEYRKHFLRRGLHPRRDVAEIAVEVAHVLDLPAIRIHGTEGIPSPTMGGHTLPAPPLEWSRLTGDTSDDLEHCRELADWARQRGFLAILCPSAARADGTNLVIYPENRPDELELRATDRIIPLNYGPEAFLDAKGFPRRAIP